jgi:hypothetical protein
MPAVKIRETGMSGDMAYSVTYNCPTCTKSAVGYSSRQRATFYGQCVDEHPSMADTVGSSPSIVELPR